MTNADVTVLPDGITVSWEREPEYMKFLKEQGDLEAIARAVKQEYDKAVVNPHIRKPVSYAVYQVWRRVDLEEEPRF